MNKKLLFLTIFAATFFINVDARRRILPTPAQSKKTPTLSGKQKQALTVQAKQSLAKALSSSPAQTVTNKEEKTQQKEALPIKETEAKKALETAIFQFEEILSSKESSIIQNAAIARTMESVAKQIEKKQIKEYDRRLHDMLALITNFTINIQKKVAELANEKGVAGGALASIIAGRKHLNKNATEQTWKIFIDQLVPIITVPPLETEDTLDQSTHIIVDQIRTNLKEALTRLKQAFTASSDVFSQRAHASVFNIITAYINTLTALSLTLEAVNEKLPEKQKVSQEGWIKWGAKKATLFALTQAVKWVIKTQTAGQLAIDLDPQGTFFEAMIDANEIGGELGAEAVSEAYSQAYSQYLSSLATNAILDDGINITLEGAQDRLSSAFKREKKLQKPGSLDVIKNLLKNETILSKTYAEVTKNLAQDILLQIRFNDADPDEGYALGSPEFNQAMQILFNSLITLSNHIQGFARANSVAGIALLSWIQKRKNEGLTNDERWKVFIKQIVPLIKTLPEPMGTQIEYETTTRFKNYEAALEQAERAFLFTAGERSRAREIELEKKPGWARWVRQKAFGKKELAAITQKNEVLADEARSRLAIVIKSYRAAILSVNNLFDHIKQGLGGPRGKWWRFAQYIGRYRAVTIGTRLSLLFGYTFAAASLLTPTGWPYFLATLTFPTIGDFVLGKIGKGAKWLISPRALTQEQVIGKIEEKEDEQILREEKMKENLIDSKELSPYFDESAQQNDKKQFEQLLEKVKPDEQ